METDPIRERMLAQLAEQREIAAKLVQDLNLVRYSIQILEEVLNGPTKTEGQGSDAPPV
jgi:hypothetical protein